MFEENKRVKLSKKIKTKKEKIVRKLLLEIQSEMSLSGVFEDKEENWQVNWSKNLVRSQQARKRSAKLRSSI